MSDETDEILTGSNAPRSSRKSLERAIGSQVRTLRRGADLSIADLAAYPWIVPHEAQGQKLEDFPHLLRWFQAIHDRPATLRAYEKGAAISTQTTLSEQARRVLFGQTAR